MKSKLIIVALIALLGFSFCQENKEQPEANTATPYIKEFNKPGKIDSLAQRVEESGDSLAYKQLKNLYLNTNQFNYLLRSALIMAVNYNSADAYFDSYIILHNTEITPSNRKSNILANYYLLKAYELGSERARYSLEERFGTNIPTSKDYRTKIGE